MRKTTSHLTAIAVSALAIAAFSSCQKTVTDDQLSETQVSELREYVAATVGTTADKVIYNAQAGNFAIGDGLVSLEDAMTRMKYVPLDGGSTANKMSQRINYYTVSSAKQSNIRMYADASVPADWLAALDNAIANWNSTNSNIYITRVTSATTTTTTTTGGNGKGKKNNGGSTTTTTTTPSYDILVTTTYNNATSTIATAYYPDYYGNPGRSITINTYYNYLNASYKVFALTHEAGHNIGFSHTDQTYGTLVPGTPEVDPNSVMNSFVLPWAGFTSYDVTAVNTVYPR
ncbi:MAG TPA: M57 family metalloprotease [Flavisolibacter sp.]